MRFSLVRGMACFSLVGSRRGGVKRALSEEVKHGVALTKPVANASMCPKRSTHTCTHKRRYTHTHIQTHTHTHTKTFSRSLSLFLFHTHTHTWRSTATNLTEAVFTPACAGTLVSRAPILTCVCVCVCVCVFVCVCASVQELAGENTRIRAGMMLT
jgi:hypothetical protein